MGRQDAQALAKAYAMKVVEEKDTQDVIVSNFYIFKTIIHALIDLGSTHSYICTTIPIWVVYRRVKPSMTFW